MSRQRIPYRYPALPNFPHKDIWSARDAAEMRDLMGRHMAAPIGDVDLVMMDRVYLARKNRNDKTSTLESRDRITPLKRQIVAGWKDTEAPTILADTDFAKMMLAAASRTPDAPLHLDEVISTAGVVFFREKQDFSQLPLIRGLSEESTKNARRMFDHLRIRAFSWFPLMEQASEGHIPLMLTLHTDGPDTQHYDEALFPMDEGTPLKPLAMFQHLCPITMGFGHLGGTDEKYDEVNPSVRMLMALVRAVSAIARSPLATETRPPVESPKQKKLRQKKKKPDPHGIRVVSLRKSEYGDYELDATTGRKVRAHWVRGHWRNQWYPSVNAHRTIWIDGFVKGDAAQGTVGGSKVYIAQGDKPAVPEEGEDGGLS